MNLKWGDRIRVLVNHTGHCDILGRADPGAGAQWFHMIGFQTELGMGPIYAVVGLQHTVIPKLLRVYTGRTSSKVTS